MRPRGKHVYGGPFPMGRNGAFYIRMFTSFRPFDSSAETAQASGGERVDL